MTRYQERFDAKHHPRPATAVVNSDGTFTVVTIINYNDGAILGPRRITIVAYDENEGPSYAVPANYAS